MTPVASPPPMRLPSAIAPKITSAIAPEIMGRVRCPLCHTVDSTMTNIALSAGAEWHCSRCGQQWDTKRGALAAGAAGLRGEQPQGREAGGHRVHPRPDRTGRLALPAFPVLAVLGLIEWCGVSRSHTSGFRPHVKQNFC